jgi:EAL domain-containing protein (putative c-di-GMP-specific phosphodiesterase class I)
MVFAAMTAPTGQEDSYSARLILGYKIGSLAILALSATWAVIFAAMGLWVLAGVDALLAAISLLSWRLTSIGRISIAVLVSQAAFFAFVVLLCLVYDVPNAAIPRVTHLFLPVLALIGYINYRRQPSRTQIALIGLCIAAFIAFSSTSVALPFAQPIPDVIRLFGSWANASFATLMAAGGIYVIQLQLQRSGSLARDLQRALWKGEFELFYQPQVDRSGSTNGAEALIRWKHPQRGYVPPGEFIPEAEQSSLAIDIGAWVLETACATLVQWAQRPETRDLTLSVNVSATQFMDETFVPSVLALVDRSGIDPKRLTLELTEHVMVVNSEAVAGKMRALRAAGLAIALDDFGTGYSSLEYLHKLPLDQLKIDRSFVKAATENARSATLVRNMVHLARDLDVSVVAEGVETAEQFALTLGAGCMVFQGYLFSRPVPLEQFEHSLSNVAAA